MIFLRNCLRFTFENLNGKLIFWPFFSHFLGFRGLLENFSPFTFPLVRLGGIFPAGVEFRRLGGRASPRFPGVKVWLAEEGSSYYLDLCKWCSRSWAAQETTTFIIFPIRKMKMSCYLHEIIPSWLILSIWSLGNCVNYCLWN